MCMFGTIFNVLVSYVVNRHGAEHPPVKLHTKIVIFLEVVSFVVKSCKKIPTTRPWLSYYQEPTTPEMLWLSGYSVRANPA